MLNMYSMKLVGKCTVIVSRKQLTWYLFISVTQLKSLNLGGGTIMEHYQYLILIASIFMCYY